MNFGDDMDTTDAFECESDIPVPQMHQADPRGGFTNVPDCAYGGVGTGAETLHADGSVTTRSKVDGSGSANAPPRGRRWNPLMPRGRLIEFREGTAAEWASTDPVLNAGEPGWERDTNVFKIGDGVSAWSALSPASSGAYVAAYVVTPTGVAATDDDALAAAIAAASTAGQGVIYIEPVGASVALMLNSAHTIPESVSLVGGGNRTSDIDCSSAVGAGITINGRGGPCGGFRVMGGGVATAPLVFGDAIEREFRSIDIRNSGGKGISLDGTQNCLFLGVNAHDSAAENLHFGNGVAGNVFVKAEISGASSGTYSVVSVNDATTFNNHLIGSIIERMDDGALGLVQVNGGDLSLVNCQLSAGEMTTPSDTNLINMTGGVLYLTNAEIRGRVQMATTYHRAVTGAAGTVHLSGRCRIDNCARAYYVEGGLRVRPDREISYTTVTQRFEDSSGGAGVEQFFVSARDAHAVSWTATATSTPMFNMFAGAATNPYLQIWGGGGLLWGPGTSGADTILSRLGANLLGMSPGDSFKVDGTWNGGTFRLGNHHLWVDSTGDLRIKNGVPTSDTDGTVVGAQS